jgi:hypothetical protein
MLQGDVKTNLREVSTSFVLTTDEGKMRRLVSYSGFPGYVARQYLSIHLALREWTDTMSLSFRNVTRQRFCRISGSTSAVLPHCCRELAARFRLLTQIVLSQEVTTRREGLVPALLVPLRAYSPRQNAEFARTAPASARAGMFAGEVMMASRQS